MAKLKNAIYIVDAFTSRSFGGNPAAVCPLKQWLPEATMQQIAMEMNQAETAFFVQKDNDFEIRWFMPHAEIDLCGHATLASAHIIFNEFGYAEKEIVFSSKSGELKARNDENGKICLDFPSRPPVSVEVPVEVKMAFPVAPLAAFASRDLILLYPTEEDIKSADPELRVLRDLPYLGVAITAKGESVDFVSRVFDANCATIPEDPVTGSTHATLIPFWAERLGKTHFHAKQLSAREGDLVCDLDGDRVMIAGSAILFLKGEIDISV